jgi:hypothetical protein
MIWTEQLLRPQRSFLYTNPLRTSLVIIRPAVALALLRKEHLLMFIGNHRNSSAVLNRPHQRVAFHFR